VGLLHGRLAAEEKAGIMESFKRGEIQVLVSTTVIEVGVDVPNATVMIIEHAERFGLAQLHQLRGRVGRGPEQSYCILIAYSGSEGSDSIERLRTLCATQDGFEIAQKDLELRGPGEIFGTRQAGLPEFVVADLVEDGELLELARREAVRVVDEEERRAFQESC
jgi:ATP-dependent DNA helicase RecG